MTTDILVGEGESPSVNNKVPSLSAAPGRGLRLDTRAWPELLSPGRGNARPAGWPLACGLEGALAEGCRLAISGWGSLALQSGDSQDSSSG